MVTLDRLKNYLRIDADFEDELLEQFLGNAISYLKGAVSNYQANYDVYPEFSDKADLLTMILAAEFYQNRDNSAHSLSYTINSLMTQLQYFTEDIMTESDTTQAGDTLGNAGLSNTSDVP